MGHNSAAISVACSGEELTIPPLEKVGLGPPFSHPSILVLTLNDGTSVADPESPDRGVSVGRPDTTDVSATGLPESSAVSSGEELSISSLERADEGPAAPLGESASVGAVMAVTVPDTPVVAGTRQLLGVTAT